VKPAVQQRIRSMVDFADTLTRDGGPLTFCLPRVHYESRDQSPHTPIIDWRAQLLLTNIDDPQYTVVGGYIDFLVVRLGYDPIAEMLSDIPGYGEHWSDPTWFAQLFRGSEVADHIHDQFNDIGPFHAVVLFQDGFVDPAFRGHRLAAWMAAQIAYRMVDDVAGFIALYPHPCARGVVRLIDDPAAFSQSTSAYWSSHLGVVPIGDGFLGQATGLTALAEAREKLDEVSGLLIETSRSEVRRRRRFGDPELCAPDDFQ
jgi:hypothetical protein